MLAPPEPERRTVDARTLIVPSRLDYAVKWRFFRHLIAGGDPDSERVYRWHIEKRTGGVEPNSWKASTDDYVTAAHHLIGSLLADGFDPDRAIGIGTNGLLVGTGAHRLSACIAAGIPIAVRFWPHERRRRPWGFEWFAENGMSPSDLARVAQDWTRMHG